MGNETLYVRDERGEFIPAKGDDVLAAAKAHLNRRVRRGVSLTSPRLVRDFLTTKLGGRDCEFFCIMAVDARHRLIEYVELFRGTIDGASVHPRVVVKLALDLGAAGVVLAHCHPSGQATPSQADERITQRLKEALGLVDIRILDHVICAAGDTVSFAELGLL